MAYTWPDGSKNHTISWSQHQANLQTQQGVPLGYWGGLPGYQAANPATPAAAPAKGQTQAGQTQAQAAAATPTSNPAIEGAYGLATGNALTGYNNTLAGLTQSENQLGNDYGFTIARNSDGSLDVPGTLADSIDPSDPFSKMAALSKAYQDQQRASTNSYAAQGQLFSGSLFNQRRADSYNNDLATSNLKSDFQKAVQGAAAARSGAASDYGNNLSGAAWQKLSAYLTGGS